ncbi:2,3-bisphosphoglycerate-independent phosphoglycerate mutase-domain-containing protein [Thamnocephalis sphaerospora]|uniref:2,3-bisphosphoglycerate-independent phosphoglycerate mutase-domain-containing protein n=1 Tax=Thamnocephalis sphaerospora TaxID=78915 RepID=A0A4P9XUA8_9FUNG|nr:2,3-bisphosphoglycerate-independent phosphoglycerate mutase-domain-containing protein [Thamnocephalis sphaerospora]|eukprot:RKP09793.1 2,3-bisphosphoglycerate-independent phosphoglycerate mutase-domain-containing protein [Thamnocephalis sphaerospora]
MYRSQRHHNAAAVSAASPPACDKIADSATSATRQETATAATTARLQERLERLRQRRREYADNAEPHNAKVNLPQQANGHSAKSDAGRCSPVAHFEEAASTASTTPTTDAAAISLLQQAQAHHRRRLQEAPWLLYEEDERFSHGRRQAALEHQINAALTRGDRTRAVQLSEQAAADMAGRRAAVAALCQDAQLPALTMTSQSAQTTGKRKLFFLLIDGIGDVAVPALDDRTPLQAAHTPNMDRLAREGVNGLLDPVEPGLACGSDTAHLSLLGYDPRIYYRGRGAFESMGAGLDMIPGDIAFKSNFATMDRSSGIVLRRRADRNFEGLGPSLCKDLDGIKLPSFPEHTVAVKYATEHRCGVRVRGPKLTDRITGTDPLKDNLPLVHCEATEDSEEARLTSQLVNELSDCFYNALNDHPINRQRIQAGKPPANCILLRGCGSRIKVPTVEELHGMRSFMIAPTCIIAGLGATIGMDICVVPGATGDYHTNVMAKGVAAVDKLLSHDDLFDFAFVHIKAVDDAGHDRNLDYKIRFLQEIDVMLGHVLQRLQQYCADIEGGKVTVCVTGDHSTPVLYGDHSSEPVPVTVWRAGGMPVPADRVCAFDEQAAAFGCLGRFCGDQIMPLLKRMTAM